jgi:cell division protein FtsQ
MAAVSRSGPARAAVLSLPRTRRLHDLTLTKVLPSGRALLLGFAILGAGVLAYVGARESSVFALRSIQVSGAPPRVAAHVRVALRPLEGGSLLALNRGEVERRLAGLSDVAGVSFDRAFPHTLRVFVTPAHSIGVLRRGSSAWIVSSDGRVVRTAGLFSAPRLPRVWIPRADSVDVGMTLPDTAAARAVQALAIARAAGFGTRIATVRSSDQELTFVLAAGPELRFGDASSLPLKLAVAERVVALVRGTNGYVDVTVPARPITNGNPQVGG